MKRSVARSPRRIAPSSLRLTPSWMRSSTGVPARSSDRAGNRVSRQYANPPVPITATSTRTARAAFLRISILLLRGFRFQQMQTGATSGSPVELNRLAIAATTHCLTGCAIGEVVGMAIATAFGWPNGAQIVLAIALAYVFGFGLTAMPLVRAGLAAGVVVSTALAADTVSITIMEAIDNLTVVLIPNAIDAGLGDVLFWASIAAGFA